MTPATLMRVPSVFEALMAPVAKSVQATRRRIALNPHESFQACGRGCGASRSGSDRREFRASCILCNMDALLMWWLLVGPILRKLCEVSLTCPEFWDTMAQRGTRLTEQRTQANRLSAPSHSVRPSLNKRRVALGRDLIPIGLHQAKRFRGSHFIVSSTGHLKFFSHVSFGPALQWVSIHRCRTGFFSGRLRIRR